MDQQSLEALCEQVDRVFSGQAKSVTFAGKEYRQSRLGKVRTILIPEEGLQFLEQNPDKINPKTGKPSDGALAARAGHRVVWLLVNGSYSGAGILDGRYTESLHRELKRLRQSLERG